MGLSAFDALALDIQPCPYDKIPERNLFQLHAPATLIVEPPSKPPQIRKATLTGIHTILGRPVAFLTIEGTKSQSAELLTLRQGQALSGIEVKSIDEKAAVVRILNNGELQILTFEAAKSPGMPSSPSPVASPPPASPEKMGPESLMTPEEQVALIELQRIKFKQEGDPTDMILPPTELTPRDGDVND